ncbi:SapC family protein [Pseudocolwellia agarivorans]|uniref:SapC family protein n=1 Tax=Pseudocolwellia agarivorans TaxID=1911682 RepID=UPI0009854F82|nr:SapC family protein [Pseudocolwellia agarivorans]
MAELIELSSKQHANLKVNIHAEADFASNQHVMNLRVSEVGMSVSSFPVFFTRNPQNGEWGISAVTSFEAGKNLFVESQQWTATYKPNGMQTYPLYLMRSPKNDNSYTIGIDESNPVFSIEEGEQFFDLDGKATPYLHQKTKLLEADIKNDMQTYEFTKHIDSLNLFKAIDLLVSYENGTVQTLKGLHTIDEDKLQALTAEQLFELNRKGYLSPIHAMLLSIYQLNLLVNKNNANTDFLPVKNIKLEINRPNHI